MLHGNEACQACAFWQRLEGEYVKLGLCRCKPPMFITGWGWPYKVGITHPAGVDRASWPITGEDDWCGEFVVAPPKNS